MIARAVCLNLSRCDEWVFCCGIGLEDFHMVEGLGLDGERPRCWVFFEDDGEWYEKLLELLSYKQTIL